MNSQSLSRIHQEFTWCFRNFFRSYTLTLIYNEFNIYFATQLWIHFHFLEFTVCFVKIPWINNLFRDNTINSLSVSWIHYEFTIYFANILWFHYFLRIDYEFTIFFANSLWIHYLSGGFTINLLGLSRRYHEFTIFFVKIPWIHYLFGYNTMNSPSFSNSLSFTFIYNEFTIYFANFISFVMIT